MIPPGIPIPAATVNLIGTVIATVLTLCVFSYLLGIRALYRLALHILIGAGVAYALVVALSTLYVRAWVPWTVALAKNDLFMMLYLGFGVLLGVLLWFKLSPRTSGLGNISTAYLVGVGLGVAAGGALTGTLVAQSMAAATPSGTAPLAFAIGLVGTLTVLISFTFTATWRRGPLKTVAQLVQILSGVGRFFLYVALGATFAGVYVASVSVLIGQAQLVGRFLDQFVLPVVRPLLSQMGLG
jgi:hypothetical protein